MDDADNMYKTKPWDELSDDLCSVDSSWSFVSITSLGPRCFPPGAIFQTMEGRCITAAELRGAGGDLLQGPDGKCARVVRAVTHKAKERDFVCIEAGGNSIEVTQDHRLIVCGPDGCPVDVPASRVTPQYVLTGKGFQPVTDRNENSKISEVVEVEFENDSPVLTWMRTTRKFRNPVHERAFIALGSRDLRTMEVKSTFVHASHPASGAAAHARSHSADAQLSPYDKRRLARARGKEWAKPS